MLQLVQRQERRHDHARNISTGSRKYGAPTLTIAHDHQPDVIATLPPRQPRNCASSGRRMRTHSRSCQSSRPSAWQSSKKSAHGIGSKPSQNLHPSAVTHSTGRKVGVYNVPNVPAIGFASLPNVIGLVAWAMKDEIIAKLDGLIDQACPTTKD